LSQCVVHVSATPACNITEGRSNSSHTNITFDSSAFRELDIQVTKSADTYVIEAELCTNLDFEPGTAAFQACTVCLSGILRCAEKESQALPFYFAVASLAVLLLPCLYCCFCAEENKEFRLAFEGGGRHINVI
jgi:hypothetical protein